MTKLRIVARISVVMDVEIEDYNESKKEELQANIKTLMTENDPGKLYFHFEEGGDHYIPEEWMRDENYNLYPELNIIY